MTFTGISFDRHGPAKPRARTGRIRARNILILRPRASDFRLCRDRQPVSAGAMADPCRSLALVGARCPCRPPAVPAGAGGGSSRRCAAISPARGFVEVEAAALQVSPGNEAHLHAFATELVDARRRARPPLSPHLARIRLQEAAGRRRAEDLRFRPRLPQPRARRAASPRIHHARMVPRRRALRGA